MPSTGLRRKFTNDDDVIWVPPPKRRKVPLIVSSSDNDDDSESDISDKDSDDYNNSEIEDDLNFIDDTDITINYSSNSENDDSDSSSDSDDSDDDSSSDSEDSDSDSSSDSDNDSEADDDETFDDNIRKYRDILENLMDKCEDIDEEFPHFHSQIRDRKRFVPIKISNMILKYCDKGEIIKKNKYKFYNTKKCYCCNMNRIISYQIVSYDNNKKEVFDIGGDCYSRIYLSEEFARYIYEYKEKNDESEEASIELRKNLKKILEHWMLNETNIKNKYKKR
jgi:hypothetical protein